MFAATISCYSTQHIEAVDLLTFSDFPFYVLNQLVTKYELKTQLIFKCLRCLNLHETNLGFYV